MQCFILILLIFSRPFCCRPEVLPVPAGVPVWVHRRCRDGRRGEHRWVQSGWICLFVFFHLLSVLLFPISQIVTSIITLSSLCILSGDTWTQSAVARESVLWRRTERSKYDVIIFLQSVEVVKKLHWSHWERFSDNIKHTLQILGMGFGFEYRS